jgi:hypothetical protein
MVFCNYVRKHCREQYLLFSFEEWIWSSILINWRNVCLTVIEETTTGADLDEEVKEGVLQISDIYHYITG